VVSKAKLYLQLDSLESELKKGLLAHLQTAAKGENDLVFCVSGFNPFRELKNRTDKKTEQFIGMSSRILSLRDKLGEPSIGTIAERICWYCSEWGNTKDYQRTSSVGLAKQFIAEIENE